MNNNIVLEEKIPDKEFNVCGLKINPRKRIYNRGYKRQAYCKKRGLNRYKNSHIIGFAFKVTHKPQPPSF